MTHTAYRMGSEDSLRMDYLMLAIAARGYNNVGCSEKMKKIARIFKKNHAVNFGDVKQGSIYRDGLNFEKIVGNLKDTSVIHTVFTNLDHVKAAVKELKAADLGISIVVTGLFKDVFEAAKEAKIKPHCVGISLGIFGKLDKLADSKYLEITTMCGHNMIGPNLVRHYLEEVRGMKMTPEAAGQKLANGCICGLFNPVRAAVLIKDLIQIQNV